MPYKLFIYEVAEKQLKKLDKHQERFIILWLLKNVDGQINPRAHGKALSENLSGYWRYRIGDYRIICEIRDDVFEIIAVKIGHRSKIYS